jgi:hypothetical protein
MTIKLTDTQEKVLTNFHRKQQAAKEHNFLFSMRGLAKELRMNYNTFYGYVGALVEKGLINKTKKSLTKAGLDYLQK